MPAYSNNSALTDPAVLKGFERLSQARVGDMAANPATLKTGEMSSGLLDERVAGAMARMGEMAARTSLDAIHLVKNSLNGGEVAPGLGSRFDQPRYQAGLGKCLNMVPLPCGGCAKRPGFEHLGMARGGEGRLVPFVFSLGESRVLEIYVTAAGCGLRCWTPEGQAHECGLTLPWTAQMLREMSFCQSADVIFCAHRGIRPAKLMRYGDTDWRYREIGWGPTIKPPAISAGIAGWWTGDGGSDPPSGKAWYVATSIDGEGNESEISAETGRTGLHTLTSSYYVKITITPVQGASEYRIYKKSQGVWGYIGRVEQPEDDYETSLEFLDVGIAADTADTPPEHRDPFAGEDDRPGVVFLHQQRLGFAASASHPLTVWLSQSGNFESMAASTPPGDDDAIEATMACPQANRILWAESDRGGLAIGTEGGEWLLTASEGQALSPKDLSFQPQSWYGSQPGLAPLRAGASLLFMQRGGEVCRDIGYSLADDRYNSSDLSLLARHMLRDDPAIQWAWQAEPFGIVWFLRASGQLSGLTCMREQEVIAWHRHETRGKITALTSIPGASGNWQVWIICEREDDQGNLSRRVERLAAFFQGGDPAGARHLDGREDRPFAARIIPLFSDVNLDSGSTFTAPRKINAIKCRVINSRPFKCRVISQGAEDSPTIPVPPRGAEYVTEADWACPIAAGFRDNPRLELILDGPDPATITGLACAVEFAPQIGGM